MNDVKNKFGKDAKLTLISIIIIAAVIAAVTACFSVVGALAVLLSGVLNAVLFYYCINKRNTEIEKLSSVLDSILSGDDVCKLSDYDEGELAILKNEVYKLTLRMKEQAAALEDDKIYLADSIADISHQLRTPLTSINIILSFLSDKSLSDEKYSEYIYELKKLLLRMEWLISSLLKISKLDAGTVSFSESKVNVKELIEKSVLPLEISMDIKNQTFVNEVNSDITFSGDLKWSAEAFGNIIKNCTEHTPEGGEVKVFAEENALFTLISISDSGPGFSEKDLPHIFERFYKGDNSAETSVGIGLALSRMIISKQNGTIKAENGKNGGAVFTIKFYKSNI